MDEEQRFRDDFSLEWDRHTKQREVIENQLQQKRITEEQSRIKHYEEYQSHLDWLRTHQNLLDRFYPGYYEQNVPQEAP